MKEYTVKKKYSNSEGLNSQEELENSEEELEKFFVVKIRDNSNNKDVTSLIDTKIEFDDDYDLTEYLAQVFDEDPDEIEIIEEESTIEFSGSGSNQG